MSNLSRAANRTKWLMIVDSYEQSELPKEQFCIEKNIKKATLDYWIRKSRIQSEQTSIAVPGFANIISKISPSDELRLHFRGVDIFVPVHLEPAVLKNLIEGLAH